MSKLQSEHRWTRGEPARRSDGADVECERAGNELPGIGLIASSAWKQIQVIHVVASLGVQGVPR